MFLCLISILSSHRLLRMAGATDCKKYIEILRKKSRWDILRREKEHVTNMKRRDSLNLHYEEFSLLELKQNIENMRREKLLDKHAKDYRKLMNAWSYAEEKFFLLFNSGPLLRSRSAKGEMDTEITQKL